MHCRERQRLLRSAYGSARYGWPGTLATEWLARPQSLSDHEPDCRATRFLDANAGGWTEPPS